MKFLYILPIFVMLASCGTPEPDCMATNERGTVVRSETDFSEYCGRGGCSKFVMTYVTVSVNGVSRTCIVSESTAKMFRPGDVINLRTGRRL